MPERNRPPLRGLFGAIAGSTTSAYAAAGDTAGDAHEPMSGGRPSAVRDVAAQDLASDIALWRFALAAEHGGRAPHPDATLRDDLSVLRILRHADGLRLLRQGLRSAFPGSALRLTTFWPEEQPHAYPARTEARPAEFGDLLVLLRLRGAVPTLDCRALFLTSRRIDQPDDALDKHHALPQINLYEGWPDFNVYARSPIKSRNATFLGKFDLSAELDPLRRVGRDQRQWRYLTPCTGLQQYAQWPGARPASPLQWRWPSGPHASGAQASSGSFTGLLRQLARPEGPGEDCSAGTDVPTWGRLINKLLDHSWEVAPSHALKSGNISSLAFWTRLRGFLTAEYLLGSHSLQKGFGASLQFEMANGLQDIARDDWTATTGFDPEDLDVPGVRGTLQRIAASRLAVFGMSAEDPAPLAAPRPQRGVTPRPDGEREGLRVLLIDVIRPSAAAL
ncbi:peroxidase [Ralstonia pickettii]|uniref:peroxidase n=1 Tax=Ralstonia pickettii TaxID=329 RepID=UPI0015F86D6E|nr:peroxidase [Ralstonia pickettii]MBB0025443.1 peroxidase [Ralstonia pickettii]MBB0036377.1 peroxidase [Ralstonia pickettii]MBB0098750.1 peroxidase [Ralstonia pickettii]MBB0108567.1 peroxidase [Ralstonia pickettii]MBB0129524.1 peroxidase [Ralstonia pickettii]